MTKSPEEIETDSLIILVRELFSRWELESEERSAIFPLDSRFEFGIQDIPSETLNLSPEAHQRIISLLEIHTYLRALYAHPRELAYSWIRKPNRAFDYKAPIEVILEGGDAGLQRVKDYLAAFVYA